MTEPGSATRERLIEFLRARNEHTVYGALGIEIESFDPDAVTVALDVEDCHKQHAGILHGGVSLLMAEGAASIAAALTTDLATHSVVGMEINANHLRRVTGGRIRAVATPVHRGRRTHVYSVEVLDDQGRCVCVSRCTIACTPLAGGLLGLG